MTRAITPEGTPCSRTLTDTVADHAGAPALRTLPVLVMTSGRALGFSRYPEIEVLRWLPLAR